MNDKGSTLIEVMVSITVFAIAMIFGTAFFTTGGQSKATSVNTSAALQLCKDSLEYAKIIDYDSLVSGTSTTIVDGMEYKKIQTVTEHRDLREKFKVVCVEHQWTGTAGNVKSVSLYTIVSAY